MRRRRCAHMPIPSTSKNEGIVHVHWAVCAKHLESRNCYYYCHKFYNGATATAAIAVAVCLDMTF